MSRICAQCQTPLEDHERCPDHPQSEPRPDHAGELFQGFRAHRMVCSSPLGDVWAGGDGQQVVAIKFVGVGQGSEDADRRLLRAAWQNAELFGSHIAPIVGSGRVDQKVAFRISSFAEGRPLAGPVPPVRAARIGAQICRALWHAHSRDLLHLNLKPNNVIVLDDDVVVTDFGLRRSLRLTPDVGSCSALFAAPELTADAVGDQRTDLYSLGALLYLAVTGKPPYPEGPAEAKAMPEIDARFGPLAELVGRLLALDPARRPSSSASVLASLETLAAPQVPPVRLTPAPTPAPSETLTPEPLPTMPSPPPEPETTVRPAPRRAVPPAPRTPPPVTVAEPAPAAEPIRAAEHTPTPTLTADPAGSPLAAGAPDRPLWPVLVALSVVAVLVVWWTWPEPPPYERVVVATKRVVPTTVAARPQDAGLPVDAAPKPSPEPKPRPPSVPRVRVRVVPPAPDAGPPPVAAPLVKVGSTPEGAAVFRDGVRVGNTPYQGEASLGRHRYTLRLKGYAPATVSLDLQPGEVVERQLNLRREGAPPAAKVERPPPVVAAPVPAPPPVAAKPKPKPPSKPRVKLIGLDAKKSTPPKAERVKMLGD